MTDNVHPILIISMNVNCYCLLGIFNLIITSAMRGICVWLQWHRSDFPGKASFPRFPQLIYYHWKCSNSACETLVSRQTDCCQNCITVLIITLYKELIDDFRWQWKVKTRQTESGLPWLDLSRSPEVDKFGTVWKVVYDFLLANYSNFVATSQRFKIQKFIRRSQHVEKSWHGSRWRWHVAARVWLKWRNLRRQVNFRTCPIFEAKLGRI